MAPAAREMVCVGFFLAGAAAAAEVAVTVVVVVVVFWGAMAAFLFSSAAADGLLWCLPVFWFGGGGVDEYHVMLVRCVLTNRDAWAR